MGVYGMTQDEDTRIRREHNQYNLDTIFDPNTYHKPALLERNKLVFQKVLDYNLDFQKGLEMCCGWGIIGSSLLLKNAVKELHYTDITQEQLDDCQINVKTCGIADRATVYKSNVWENIDTTFDFIIVNPPWWANKIEYMVNMGLREEAWLDKDWAFHKRFFKGLKEHLNPGGRCLLIESSLGSHISEFEPMVPDGLVASEIKIPTDINPSWLLEVKYA
jgi:methylase of polypeptide subunit release factors